MDNITGTNDTEGNARVDFLALIMSDTLIVILKGILMGTIIIASVFGNLLVIISVSRYRKLRTITNYLLVSLAFADFLVALVAMVFNASVVIYGKWLFGFRMCDAWNSFDVYFSTASILHLCCISVDRYYAISEPLLYLQRITRKKVVIMVINCWLWPAVISFLPIFLGWYTTEEHLKHRLSHLEECEFVVNRVYAIISSSMSFWIPCSIMLFTYYRIYRMANHQEKLLSKDADTAQVLKRQYVNDVDNLSPASYPKPPLVNSKKNSKTSEVDGSDLQLMPLKDKRLSKLKREHKAAKTLGIIMGAFILCWLPFFTWYITMSLCGQQCFSPPILTDVLFWIGYFNSTLNPIIYAYFHRDFREAFRRTLLCIFCVERTRDIDQRNIIRINFAENSEIRRNRSLSVDTKKIELMVETSSLSRGIDEAKL
ncbi:octopamine receptor beta-2R-like [Artemia franciscana]|uniref:G-protein coupled receptors family 1 profile domain-containing protein n=1 Tax=Artemia franciscana TaxID=6661 RepID=A0AA88HUY8_ARTSF|nr:hypothetical protein QYM36_011321 [Artemia franciscana]